METVKLLLDRGADATITFGNLPIHAAQMAEMFGHAVVAKVIRQCVAGGYSWQAWRVQCSGASSVRR